jgi:hypothetical protein
LTFLLSAWPRADEPLDQAVAADPPFALAHAAPARLYVMRGKAELATAEAGLARQLVAQRGTERERGHVEVIGRGIEEPPKQALRQVLAIPSAGRRMR